MAARAIPARAIGYTKTHRTYQVISNTGKQALAKNPKPIDQPKEDSDREEENLQWPRKPVQDLEDIVNGQPGGNYGWHCPEKQECAEGTHVENRLDLQTPITLPDSPISAKKISRCNAPPSVVTWFCSMYPICLLNADLCPMCTPRHLLILCVLN